MLSFLCFKVYFLYNKPSLEPLTSCLACSPGSRSLVGGSWRSGKDLFIFGGSHDSDSYGGTAMMNDVWSFNLDTRVWVWVGGEDSTNATNPEPTLYASVVYDADASVVWTYGGYDKRKLYYNLLISNIYSPSFRI